MKEQSHRIARFSLPAEFVHFYQPLVLKLMSGLVVTSAALNRSSREIDYTAISDIFHEVPAGQAPPTLKLVYVQVPNASGGRDLVDIRFALPPLPVPIPV